MDLPVSDKDMVAIDDIILCARLGELDEMKRLVDAMCSEVEVGARHDCNLHFLSSCNQAGNTSLHMAAANGHMNVVSHLLQHLNVQMVNTVNALGNTALHWASMNGHVQVVARLIDAGASLLLTNDAGKTPLIEAQDAGHELVAIELLKHMDPDQDENCSGVPPLHDPCDP